MIATRHRTDSWIAPINTSKANNTMQSTDEELSVPGGVRRKKGGILLIIYSTPLARILIKKLINKASIKYNKGKITIEKGNEIKLHYERRKKNQPLCLAFISKILPNDIKEQITEKQQKLIVVINDFVKNAEELNLANKRKNHPPKLPLPTIKDSDKIEMGCGISYCGKEHKNTYRFGIRHKIAGEIANKGINVGISRDKMGNFYLIPHEKGRTLNLYTYPTGIRLAHMQLSSNAITEEEKKMFDQGKRHISYRVYLSAKEFKINIAEHFPYKTEKELASALLRINIPIKHPRMRAREADIVILPSKSQIEITTLKQRRKQNHNSSHSEGVHINARICEGYLRVSKNLTPLYILVCDERWLNEKWVKELQEATKKEVFIVATNFKDNWQNAAAKTIKEEIKNRKL